MKMQQKSAWLPGIVLSKRREMVFFHELFCPVDKKVTQGKTSEVIIHSAGLYVRNHAFQQTCMALTRWVFNHRNEMRFGKQDSLLPFGEGSLDR